MKSKIIPNGETPMELMVKCEGWYRCPKNVEGQRIGPLVGYAARYDGVHQWVGEEYVNFARAERHPLVLRYFAGLLRQKIENAFSLDDVVFCGMPLGGIRFAGALSDASELECIFLEKEVTAVKTADSREQSRLVVGRHDIEEGQPIIFVEDIVNNVSTTAEAIELVTKAGASVLAIACFLNRSLIVEDVYQSPLGPVPVISVVRQKIMEYRQDDPFVVADIQRGNVCWKPKRKSEWAQLAAAMSTN